MAGNMTVPLTDTDPRLIAALRALADDYGPKGVLDTARQMWVAESPTDSQVSTAGGWCAPMGEMYDLFPRVPVKRGGITYPSPEEVAAAEAKRKQYLHNTRWKRRRRNIRRWATLRPLRYRIHNHIHRNCEDY